MIKLIVFDVYNTLFTDSHRRKGVVDFLSANPDVRSTIYTDVLPESRSTHGTEREYISRILEEMGVAPKLQEPYFFGDTLKRGYKDLSAVTREFGVNVDDVVMIGDSDQDSLSAYKSHTRVIRITPLVERNSDQDLSFEVIGDVTSFLDSNLATRIDVWKGRLHIQKGSYKELGFDRRR